MLDHGLMSAQVWAIWEISASLVPSSLAFEAARVMTSQQRSGRRASKLVLVVAFAVGLALLAPPAPCNAAEPPPGMVRVFHYTNKAGYDGIIESGSIRPSDINQGDAFYGTGVYCTELKPTRPIWDILKNNYDNDGGVQGRGEDKMDRADYYFAFDLPVEEVTSVAEGTRSVASLGNGDPVKLEKAFLAGRASEFEDALERRIKLYHYTDQEGYEAIMAKGVLKRFSFLDFVICRGFVWDFNHTHTLTILPPDTHPLKILHENFYVSKMYSSDIDKQDKLLGRAKYVFAFDLPQRLFYRFSLLESKYLRVANTDLDAHSATYHGLRVDVAKWMAKVAEEMKRKPFLYKDERECWQALQNKT